MGCHALGLPSCSVRIDLEWDRGQAPVPIHSPIDTPRGTVGQGSGTGACPLSHYNFFAVPKKKTAKQIAKSSSTIKRMILPSVRKSVILEKLYEYLKGNMIIGISTLPQTRLPITYRARIIAAICPDMVDCPRAFFAMIALMKNSTAVISIRMNFIKKSRLDTALRDIQENPSW